MFKRAGIILSFCFSPPGFSHGPSPAPGRREKCQTACKPGSVRAFWRETAIPLGRASRHASRDQPGRQGGNASAPAFEGRRHRPYSVLLPVGFTLPPLSPGARGALTAPFHPCPSEVSLAWAVCFLWHCPWGRPRRPLAGTVFPWSPDFPPSSFDNSGRPAVWRAGHAAVGRVRQAGRPCSALAKTTCRPRCPCRSPGRLFRGGRGEEGGH